MGKSSFKCPQCGASVPVSKTVTIPAMDKDMCKGWPLDSIRYQCLRCSCGWSGDRPVFIGRIKPLPEFSGVGSDDAYLQLMS